MANQKRGRQSFIPPVQPVIAAWASIAGKKESEGPLKPYFDETYTDNHFGERSWEQAEKKLQQMALNKLLQKTLRKVLFLCLHILQDC